MKYKTVRIPEPLYNVISEIITESFNSDGVSEWVTKELIQDLKILATSRSFEAREILAALKESGVKVNEKTD